MLSYLTPDVILDDVYEIDFDKLRKRNIKGIIFDIDNTLVSYKQEKPTENVAALMEKLTGEGFKICFVSNNTKERVDIFNGGFEFFSFAAAKKPFVKYIIEAQKAMELPRENIALVGDQIFTDVAAAKRAKIMAVLVKPIEPVETLFFRFKRFLEKPLIKRYYRRLNKK
jgi:hypothetical protein